MSHALIHFSLRAHKSETSALKNSPFCLEYTGSGKSFLTQVKRGGKETFNVVYKKCYLCINKIAVKIMNCRASSTLNPEFNEAEVSMLK